MCDHYLLKILFTLTKDQCLHKYCFKDFRSKISTQQLQFCSLKVMADSSQSYFVNLLIFINSTSHRANYRLVRINLDIKVIHQQVFKKSIYIYIYIYIYLYIIYVSLYNLQDRGYSHVYTYQITSFFQQILCQKYYVIFLCKA